MVEILPVKIEAVRPCDTLQFPGVIHHLPVGVRSGSAVEPGRLVHEYLRYDEIRHGGIGVNAYLEDRPVRVPVIVGDGQVDHVSNVPAVIWLGRIG